MQNTENITIRELRVEDLPQLECILKATKVFSEEEVNVALELMEICLSDKNQKDYIIYVANDVYEKILGYTCFGPTSLTDGTYDLYWIAVDSTSHGSGVGGKLQKFTENYISKLGGRLLIAETSSKPEYSKARNFYILHNYKEVARIKDFYRIGDDRVIYGKYLSQSKEHSN